MQRRCPLVAVAVGASPALPGVWLSRGNPTAGPAKAEPMQMGREPAGKTLTGVPLARAEREPDTGPRQAARLKLTAKGNSKPRAAGLVLAVP